VMELILTVHVKMVEFVKTKRLVSVHILKFGEETIVNLPNVRVQTSPKDVFLERVLDQVLAYAKMDILDLIVANLSCAHRVLNVHWVLVILIIAHAKTEELVVVQQTINVLVLDLHCMQELSAIW